MFWGIETLLFINFKKKKSDIFFLCTLAFQKKLVLFIWISIYAALLHMSVVIRPYLCLLVLYLCIVNFFMIAGSMTKFGLLSHIRGKDNLSLFHYISLLTTRGKNTDCIKVYN